MAVVSKRVGRIKFNRVNIYFLFLGVGIGMTVVSGLVGIYYNIIIAWSIYYLFASFTSQLPWEFCGNEWNSPCKYKSF